jgi:predicted transcriptional regulator
MADEANNIEPTEGEKPASKLTAAQQEMVNGILKRERERLQSRHEAEIKALQAQNDALQAKQKEIDDRIKADCEAEIEALKEGADPAVLGVFEALPETMAPEEKRDFLRKLTKEIPAQPKTQMPRTPTGKAPPQKWEPYPVKESII